MTVIKEELQIVDVNAELAKLGAEGKKKGMIRGCLFNLIVYAQDPQRALFLNGTVEGIKETFPCRIIFIECHCDSKENFLKVSVDEESFNKDEASISCDRININFTPHYAKRVPYIVLPHFIPDVPIYLLWGQDPSQENEILPYFEKFASRLIFDSDSSCDIRAFCQKMLTDVAHKKIPVTDLNWASLTSWREILNQVFDTPEKVNHLRHSKQLNIRYNSYSSAIYQHTERRSLYLQGWLAELLGWEYLSSSHEENKMKIIYKNKQEEVVVTLTGEKIATLTPGAIINIEILAADQMIFDIKRINNEPFVKVHISKKEACDLPLTLPIRHFRKGLVFMNEIFFGPCSEHYWNMLKALQTLQVPC